MEREIRIFDSSETLQSPAFETTCQQMKYALRGEIFLRQAIQYGVENKDIHAQLIFSKALESDPVILSESQKKFIEKNSAKDLSELNHDFLNDQFIITPAILSDEEKLEKKQKIEEDYNNNYPDIKAGEEYDKLDVYEALITIEDCYIPLIQIGEFEEAQKVLSRVFEINVEEEQYESDIVRCYLEGIARISLSQLAISKDLNLQNLTQQQINSIIKGNDHELLQAAGFLGLVKEIDITLPPEKKIALANGMRLLNDETNINSVDIFKGQKNPHTAKSFIKTVYDKKDIDLAREELEKEIYGKCDINIVGKLLKGLIEKGDVRSKEMAVVLFQREDLPQHFRIYVARKLCDSGHWSRQILDTFKDYRAEGADKIKLESLTAIIKQMHQTPSLELYKVLEQTRITKDSETLNLVADFGRKIFSLSNLYVESKLEIFSFWAKKVQKGLIEGKDLDDLDKYITKITQATEKFWHKTGIDRRYGTIHTELKRILMDESIASGPDETIWCLDNGLLPTPILTNFKKIDQTPEETIEKLKELTDNGHFDPRNLVQRDLEYARYIKLNEGGPFGPHSYKLFQELDFAAEETTRRLNLHESMEAEAAAYEAANFYWLVKSRVDKGRKVSVVGNRRYGDYFVTDVLRRELEDLKVQVSSYKISSGYNHPDTIENVFPTSFINGISAETPDIIIVDGTPHCISNSNGRLPRAMEGYNEWFNTYNETLGIDTEKQTYYKNSLEEKIAKSNPAKKYEVAFWSPMNIEKINLGNSNIVKSNQIPETDLPLVILANPVAVPNRMNNFPDHLEGHQAGFFDDPEKYINGTKKIVFTKNGVKEWAPGSVEEGEYINMIQNQMLKILPKIIRETNPLF